MTLIFDNTDFHYHKAKRKPPLKEGKNNFCKLKMCEKGACKSTDNSKE